MSAPPTHQLSRATPADLPAIMALLQQCELLETGVADAVDRFLIARADDRVIGCAGLEVYADKGLLRSVAVAASARKVGLGGALVRGIVAAARDLRLSELFLLTSTAPEFFERLGFAAVVRGAVPAPVGQSWEFRVGCPQTARAMRLALASPPSSRRSA